MAGAGLFDDAYYHLIAPFHPEAETRREVAALREALGLAQDDRILDLGCGWGRHLRLLRQAGHQVVGVDLSVELLRHAAAAAPPPAPAPSPSRAPQVAGTRADDAASRAPGLVAGDMRRLPFRDGAFDAVINLATSLGLFLDDAGAEEALAEAARVLRPGGRFLVEGMHRDDVVAHYAMRDGWRMPDGTEVRVRRRFDPTRDVSHEVLRWRGPAGRGSKRHSLRLRSAGELDRLLGRAGLAVTDAYGDWALEPFERDAPLLILVARR